MIALVIGSSVVIVASLIVSIVNLWRTDRNMARIAKHREAIFQFRMGDLDEGHRLKVEADAMPVYDAWPNFRRRLG